SAHPAKGTPADRASAIAGGCVVRWSRGVAAGVGPRFGLRWHPDGVRVQESGREWGRVTRFYAHGSYIPRRDNASRSTAIVPSDSPRCRPDAVGVLRGIVLS